MVRLMFVLMALLYLSARTVFGCESFDCDLAALDKADLQKEAV